MASTIEGLERRQLLAASLLRVSSVTADNRGEVVIQLSERATGVKGAALQFYTAGGDGKLFTDDDTRVYVRFTYSTNKKQIKLQANLDKNTPYRIKLDGKTRIKSEASGQLLDGDWNGSGKVSGDGRAGGNFEFQTSREVTDTPLVKMRTNVGDIVVKVRYDVAPISANAFLGLTNAGKYDNLLITRVAKDFVVQTGSVQMTGNGSEPTDLVGNTAPSFGEESPRVLSNVRGTLSFARGGGLASNQFFFNVANNNGTGATTNLDDANGGGGALFTPFAEVVDKNSLATVDVMNGKSVFDLTGLIGPFNSTGVDSVPIDDINDVTDGTFRPFRDGIIIERTGVLMRQTGKND